MGLSGLVFMLAFAAGCILAFARHPIWGLVTYVGVFYVHPPSRWWGAGVPQLRWSLIASGVCLLAVFMSRQTKDNFKPALNNKLVVGYSMFLVWCLIQCLWALNPDMHYELIGLVFKYILLVVLMIACIETDKEMKIFLWSHVAGCAYLGWIAYTDYDGGRFEGFGGPNINEANAGALQIVTAIFVAGSLFLFSRWRERAILFPMIALMVNGLVTTVSRSAFLAAAAGGIVFNLFIPKQYKKSTRVLSILAIVAFMLVTNPMYWARMNSIGAMGEEVEGVDTGAGRLTLIKAQWQMFLRYPLGCGHRCTATLSRDYLPESDLTTNEQGQTARSSHSTVMSMITEHGIPGAFFYIAQVLWVWSAGRKLAKSPAITEHPFLSVVFPAALAGMVALFIQDEFVDDLRLEVRFWFMAILFILLKYAAQAVAKTAPVPARSQRFRRAVPAARGATKIPGGSR